MRDIIYHEIASPSEIKTSSYVTVSVFLRGEDDDEAVLCFFECVTLLGLLGLRAGVMGVVTEGRRFVGVPGRLGSARSRSRRRMLGPGLPGVGGAEATGFCTTGCE